MSDRNANGECYRIIKVVLCYSWPCKDDIEIVSSTLYCWNQSTVRWNEIERAGGTVELPFSFSMNEILGLELFIVFCSVCIQDRISYAECMKGELVIWVGSGVMTDQDQNDRVQTFPRNRAYLPQLQFDFRFYRGGGGGFSEKEKNF